MPTFSGYLRSNQKVESFLDTLDDANPIAFLLDRQSVSLVLVRSGIAQTAQNVVAVPPGESSRGSESRGATGESAEYDVLLIGVRDHATLTDFDVKRADRFLYNSTWHEVIDIDNTLAGKTEARCRARQ